jgi:hypothetical protein
MTPTLSVLRRCSAALLALAVTSVAGALVAAPAEATTPGVYSVPYASTLYVHTHTARGPVTKALTFTEWAARSYPTPTPIATDLVRYSWSPAVYAVSFFDDGWLWKHLSQAQWAFAGYPEPRLAGHIEGTEYFKFPDQTTIFAGLDGWALDLTHDEWARSGFQQPVATNLEYFKLTWTETIVAFEYAPRGDGVLQTSATFLSLEAWQAAGSPQPWVMPMLAGDQLCSIVGREDLYYLGTTYQGYLPYELWQRAGFPAPDPECVLGAPAAG